MRKAITCPHGITPKTTCKECKRLYNTEYHKKRIFSPDQRAKKRDKTKVWYREHPRARWRKNLYYTYGITPEQYDSLFAAQDGKCAVCKQPPSKRRLAVDHSHYTNEIRGLLCSNCNNKVVKVVEDYPHLIEIARAYLARYEQSEKVA